MLGVDYGFVSKAVEYLLIVMLEAYSFVTGLDMMLFLTIKRCRVTRSEIDLFATLVAFYKRCYLIAR